MGPKVKKINENQMTQMTSKQQCICYDDTVVRIAG